jgi:RimJ/RimL family protein N-acetyltransferase
MEQARERNFVYKDQYVSLTYGDPELEEMESEYTTPDGVTVQVRPIRPDDEEMVRELIYSYSAETLLHRFFRPISSMPHEEIQKLIELDYTQDMILAAVAPRGEGEMIVAVGRYHVAPDTGAAEVAFSMRDDWQRKGVGTHLFRELIDIARHRGVSTFIADVMLDNLGMVNLFHKCAMGPVSSTLEDGAYRLEFTVPPELVKPDGDGA